MVEICKTIVTNPRQSSLGENQGRPCLGRLCTFVSRLFRMRVARDDLPLEAGRPNILGSRRRLLYWHT